MKKIRGTKEHGITIIKEVYYKRSSSQERSQIRFEVGYIIPKLIIKFLIQKVRISNKTKKV